MTTTTTIPTSCGPGVNAHKWIRSLITIWIYVALVKHTDAELNKNCKYFTGARCTFLWRSRSSLSSTTCANWDLLISWHLNPWMSRCVMCDVRRHMNDIYIVALHNPNHFKLQMAVQNTEFELCEKSFDAKMLKIEEKPIFCNLCSVSLTTWISVVLRGLPYHPYWFGSVCLSHSIHTMPYRFIDLSSSFCISLCACALTHSLTHTRSHGVVRRRWILYADCWPHTYCHCPIE